MNKYLSLAMSGVTAVIVVLLKFLGGWNISLSTFAMFCVIDIILGVTCAVFFKELSSREFGKGVIRKLCSFLLITVAVKLDSCLGTGQNPILIFGFHLSIRQFTLIYLSLEQLISILEKLAKMGVPFPKWVISTLIQVRNCTNSSTPKYIIDLVKKIFGITITSEAASNISSALVDTVTELKKSDIVPNQVSTDISNVIVGVLDKINTVNTVDKKDIELSPPPEIKK